MHKTGSFICQNYIMSYFPSMHCMYTVDYWTANKCMKECQSLRLFVEAFYKQGEQAYMLTHTTDPLVNASKYTHCFTVTVQQGNT